MEGWGSYVNATTTFSYVIKKISEFPIASNLFNFSNTAYSEETLEYLKYDEEDLNDCVQNVFGAFLD